MSFKNHKPTFLDVDTSIVENNLRFAQDVEEDDLNKLFGTIAPDGPSKLVKPSPGFCVKTKEVGSGKKVFINVCKTDSIPPPKDISENEIVNIIESSENYRIPMSIGEIRPEKDKKGEDAKACDIAIHPDFLKKVEASQTFKNFFMAIVFQALEDKYGLVCVDEKIILKNIKAFGTLQMHGIRQREIKQKMGESGEKSLIEEITGKSESNRHKISIETLSSTENVIRQPEYRLYKRKDGQNCLIGEFKLPDVISAKELTLDIGEDRILLESKNRRYLLDIFVPCIIKQKSCTSYFEKMTKILTVTMPLVGG